MKALASENFGPVAARVERLLEPHESDAKPLGQAFNDAHSRLLASYQSEYSYKNQIVSKIVLGRHSLTTASALIEQPMSASVADVLVLNGTSTVYEVKTDLDSFARLQAQVRDYIRHAEYVYVVVSERRASTAKKNVPEEAGIITLRPRGNLSVIRPAPSNLATLRHTDIFRLLRTGEALSVMRATGGDPQKSPSGHARDVAYAHFRALPLLQAHEAVVQALKLRSTSARALLSDPGFPSSLRSLAYATELSVIGSNRLSNRLKLPISAILDSV